MNLFWIYTRDQINDTESIGKSLSERWAKSNASSLETYQFVSGFFLEANELKELENQIQNSNGMVVLISPESVVSESIATLISIAERMGKPKLPIIIEHPRSGKEHRLFDYYNAIDLTDSYSLGMEQILAVIETWQ